MWVHSRLKHFGTGKPVSEAFIFASVNPQYENRLFIDLWFQYEKNTSSEHGHGVYKYCFECQNKNKKPMQEWGLVMIYLYRENCALTNELTKVELLY